MEKLEKVLEHLSGMSATALAFIVVLAALAVVWKALDRSGPKKPEDRERRK